MQIIEVIGTASGKSWKISVSDVDLTQNLLNWLRENNITIASSCNGEGICQRCTIQNDWQTCSMTVKEFFNRQPDGKIFVSYL